MNVKTYIFGNPDGWKLYNKDQTEVAYFKSFYVNTRRGERLMVNRRDDGSIVYVYLMYGVSEIQTDANGERKRGGYGHFGMAMILENGEYTPEFGTVFRFMSTLFNRMLERDDSPIVRNATPLYAANGEMMPYSYRISRFDQAGEVMEWLQSMMPKIFDKTGLTPISTDGEFEDGAMGRIATLSDEAADGEILNAFHKNCWIAISPEFTKTPDSDSNSSKMEVNLFDISRLHSKLADKLLDWALSAQKVSQGEKDAVHKRISETRALLANYERSNPSAEDINETHELQNSFSNLAEKLDKIRVGTPAVATGRKPEPVVIPTSRSESNNDANSANNRIRIDNGRSQSTSGSKRGEDPGRGGLDSLGPKLAGIAAVIVIFVVGSIALINSNDGGNAPDPGSLSVLTPIVRDDNTGDKEKFEQLIHEKSFAEAYNLIKDTSDKDTFISSLKTETEEYLWSLVDIESLSGIDEFFKRRSNQDMLTILGYDVSGNDYEEWFNKITVHNGLKSLSEKNSTTNEDIAAAKQSNEQLGNRYADLVDIVSSKLPKVIVPKRGSGNTTTQSPEVNIPVTLTFINEKTKYTKNIIDNNGVSFDVKVNTLIEGIWLDADNFSINYNANSELYNAVPAGGKKVMFCPKNKRKGTTDDIYVEQDGKKYYITINFK